MAVCCRKRIGQLAKGSKPIYARALAGVKGGVLPGGVARRRRRPAHRRRQRPRVRRQFEPRLLHRRHAACPEQGKSECHFVVVLAGLVLQSSDRAAVEPSAVMVHVHKASLTKSRLNLSQSHLRRRPGAGGRAAPPPPPPTFAAATPPAAAAPPARPAAAAAQNTIMHARFVQGTLFDTHAGAAEAIAARLSANSSGVPRAERCTRSRSVCEKRAPPAVGRWRRRSRR